MTDRLQLLYVVAIWILVHTGLFWFYGIREAFVDSQRYIAMADHLLANGRPEHTYQVFYSLPVLLLALFRAMFGEEGSSAFVIFQSCCSLLAAIALYSACQRLFKRQSAGIPAVMIYFLWIDCIQWNTAVMTESLSSAITCFVIWKLATLRNTPRDYVVLAAFLLLGLLTRPTGILAIAATAVYFFSSYRAMLRSKPFAGWVVTGIALILLMSVAFLMLDQWDFTDQYERGNIVTYVDRIGNTDHRVTGLRLDPSELVKPDPAMRPFAKVVSFAVHNPVHFATAAFLKIFYTVSWYRPYFSTAHNVYSFVWLGLIYAFAWRGWKCQNHPGMSGFILALIVLNCLLVAVSAADWDNRFFMPMQPAIVILAGGGMACLLGKMKSQDPA